MIENERPRSYAANLNAAFARTAGELIAVCNPDAVPAPDAVRILAEFMQSTPRCGIAGPQMFDPTVTWQPSRRRFPTVIGTVVRRTPLRRAFPPLERQRAHYLLDERPTEPVETDWMLGGFLLLRRTMLDEIGGYDAGFRMYGEDIDLSLPRRARGLGALVRPRRGRSPPLGPADRPALVHAADALALAGDVPVRAQAPRAAAIALAQVR